MPLDPNVTYQITESGAETDALLDTIGTDALTTTAQTLTGAVNELDGEVAQNTSDIGSLDDLTTTDKDSLVNAVNEIVGNVEGVSGLFIQSGMVSSVTFAANTYTDANVTFTEDFASAPNVVIGLRSSSTSTNMHLLTVGILSSSVTASGFTIRGWNGHTSSFAPSIYWIAIGKKGSGNALNSINPINLNPLSPSIEPNEPMDDEIVEEEM